MSGPFDGGAGGCGASFGFRTLTANLALPSGSLTNATLSVYTPSAPGNWNCDIVPRGRMKSDLKTSGEPAPSAGTISTRSNLAFLPPLAQRPRLIVDPLTSDTFSIVRQ